MTGRPALLARYRRYWGLLLLGVLAVPMTLQALQPVAVSSEDEARMLSLAPAWPQTSQDWRALPRRLDRFLADHFGLRAELVRAHGRLRYAVHLPSDLRVIIGRDSSLFLNGDATIEQATGKLLRESEIAKFADRAAALRARLIEPAHVLRGFVPIEGGDLARLLAISGDVIDEDADIDLTPYGPRPFEVGAVATQFESGGDLIETGREGPTVVVVGDSFTRGYWQDYFALRAGRYVWMHHEQCGFMLSVVESYAPDIVILAPTERQMFCTGR